jgi:hypothetical protein
MKTIATSMILMMGLTISAMSNAAELPADCTEAINAWKSAREELVGECLAQSAAGTSPRSKRMLYVKCIRLNAGPVQDAYSVATLTCPEGTPIQ